MMHRRWLPTFVALAAVTGLAVAADLQSGLQVGDAAGVFHVKDITGPNKGKSLCYR